MKDALKGMRPRGGLVRAAALVALSVTCFALPASARQATYRNPVIAGDHPDPSVIRVGGDYYATTTTGGWAPHFPIFHSRDLVNWRVTSYVFRTKPAWARGDFWAPEIIHDRGRFFVYYTARRDEGPQRRGTLCVAVSTARRPTGPYTDRGPLVCEIPERGNVGSIDAFFVRDERGAPFLVWKADGNDAEPDQPTSIFAQRLSADGTRLRGRRREILRNTDPWERHVTEGSYILRRGGWFYHFYSGNACCGRECDYALGVARARKLLGPWEKSPRNPIVDDNAEWQCPGHGSVVSTPDGRAFLLYHSYRRRPGTFNVGRETLLDEIRWGADGWPVVNAGRGPSSVAPAPLGVAEAERAEVFDDFNSPVFDPAWQWPMSVRQSEYVDLADGGQLVLTPGSNPKGDDLVAAVLARPTLSGDYTAEARVRVGGLRRPGVLSRAGLAAYSWRDAAVGISVGDDGFIVWRREGRERRTVAQAPLPAHSPPFAHLRMTATDGEAYRFAFRVDGDTWRELGGAVDGRHVEGARLALTAAGGPARFDWVRIRSMRDE